MTFHDRLLPCRSGNLCVSHGEDTVTSKGEAFAAHNWTLTLRHYFCRNAGSPTTGVATSVHGPRKPADFGFGCPFSSTGNVTLGKDIDFASATLTVPDSKGGKDRTTVLPVSLQTGLQAHLIPVAQLHTDDRNRGAGLALLPGALELDLLRRPIT